MSTDIKRKESSSSVEKASITHQDTPDQLTAAIGAGGIVAAKSGNDFEHRLTLREGIRLYPRAIAWSLLISLAVIMEGYDNIVIYNFFGCVVLRRCAMQFLLPSQQIPRFPAQVRLPAARRQLRDL